MVIGLKTAVTIENISVTDENVVVTGEVKPVAIDNKLVIGGNREKAIRYSR